MKERERERSRLPVEQEPDAGLDPTTPRSLHHIVINSQLHVIFVLEERKAHSSRSFIVFIVYFI